MRPTSGMGGNAMRTARIVGIAAVFAAVALAVRLSLLSYGLYTLIIALLAAELAARFSLDGIECIRDIRVDRAKLGEQVTVSTIIRNEKPIPVPWVLAEETLPPRLAREGEHTKLLVMRPYGDTRLHYTLTMNHRGYHQIGPAILESGDLFGFVRKFRTARAAHYITVQPEVVPILRYDLATRRPIGEVRVKRLLHEDPTRMAGLRDYAPGDSLNRIHWKAFARTGFLHSKIYEQTTLAGALVVLDFHGPAYEGDEEQRFYRSELGVKIAASLAGYLTELKQHVGLLSNGLDAAERAKREAGGVAATSRQRAREIAAHREGADRLRPVEVSSGRGHGQAMKALDALARLELSEGLPLERMLIEEYTRLPRDLTLIVVTPMFTPTLFQVMARVKFSGFQMAAILIANPAQAEHARIALAGENIRFFHIARPSDLSEIARSGI